MGIFARWAPLKRAASAQMDSSAAHDLRSRPPGGFLTTNPCVLPCFLVTFLGLDFYIGLHGLVLFPERMQTDVPRALAILLTCLVAVGSPHASKAGAESQLEIAQRMIRQMQEKFAPDDHLAIYDVAVEQRGQAFVVSGEVDKPEAKAQTARALESAGIRATNEITVLPAEELGDKTWGISTLSVANGREEPEQKAELGTQILMGHTVRIWKRSGRWLLVQSKDGYLSWSEGGNLVRCAEKDAKAWENGPLLIVTAMEDQIVEAPNPSAQPVSDVVLGDLVKQAGESGEWYNVQLPDERHGFIPKKAATNLSLWKETRKAEPEAIERTARLFLGRPYLWGGNSPKGLDCSGFTKMVFFVNGIELNRNASHQALQGLPVPLDPEFANLKKGDLLFFGWGGRRERQPRVSHVAIYLGNKMFIQSSQRVRVSSLDPASPVYDEQYSRSLISAQRVLK